MPFKWAREYVVVKGADLMLVIKMSGDDPAPSRNIRNPWTGTEVMEPWKLALFDSSRGGKLAPYQRPTDERDFNTFLLTKDYACDLVEHHFPGGCV